MRDNKAIYEEMQDIRVKLLNKEIPDRYPPDMSRVMQPYSKSPGSYYIEKFDFINISSFVPVSKSWARRLAVFLGKGKCLEIMAGKGVLTKCLKDFGTVIRATDDYSWKWHRSQRNKSGKRLSEQELWCEVEELDAVLSVEKYGGETDFIICCCPPFGDECLYDSLIKMRKINPKCKMIYIGEGRGGCHAEGKFFSAARFIKDDRDFNHVTSLYQNWPLIEDKLNLVV